MTRLERIEENAKRCVGLVLIDTQDARWLLARLRQCEAALREAVGTHGEPCRIGGCRTVVNGRAALAALAETEEVPRG